MSRFKPKQKHYAIVGDRKFEVTKSGKVKARPFFLSPESVAALLDEVERRDEQDIRLNGWATGYATTSRVVEDALNHFLAQPRCSACEGLQAVSCEQCGGLGVLMGNRNCGPCEGTGRLPCPECGVDPSRG